MNRVRLFAAKSINSLLLQQSVNTSWGLRTTSEACSGSLLEMDLSRSQRRSIFGASGPTEAGYLFASGHCRGAVMDFVKRPQLDSGSMRCTLEPCEWESLFQRTASSELAY